MRSVRSIAAGLLGFGLTACQTTALPTVTILTPTTAEPVWLGPPGGVIPASATEPARTAEVVVIARGTSSEGTYPRIRLLINGREVGATAVGEEFARYAFHVPVGGSGEPVRLAVHYANDRGSWSPVSKTGEDRNLFVHSIAVNGTSLRPEAPNVVFDRGPIDGVDVLEGRSRIWWGGALIFTLPPALFDGEGAPAAAAS